MTFTETLQLVKTLESEDIYTLLENRGVHIEHRPDLFTASKCDARIITNTLGSTCIFLRLRPGEDPLYENYILWHELGHLENEGYSVRYRTFNQETACEESETDANVFAFLALVSKISAVPDSLYELAHKIGMPYLLLADLMQAMRSDPEFINYVMRRKHGTAWS